MNLELVPINSGEKGCKRGTEMCPFCTPFEFRQLQLSSLECMAGTTGLEPATSAVTGQHSNQLNYVPIYLVQILKH